MKVAWNPGQLLPTFDYTVTLLNKRDHTDSPMFLDEWKATVIHNCTWTQQLTRDVSGSDVSLGASYIVRIPKQTDYWPYAIWKHDMEGITFSVGDYLIKGEITEEVTADNVQEIVNRIRPDAFEIKFFRDNTGTVEALEHYHLEGV